MSFRKQVTQSLIWRGLYFVTILIINIVLSRHLQAGNTGWVYYLSNNFSFILLLVGLTIENGVNYYASKNEIDHNRLAWFAIGWTAMIAALVFVGLWLYFPQLQQASLISRAEYIYFGLCYIAGIQLINFFTVLFYANKNFFLPNFLLVLLNIGLIIVIPKQAATSATETALTIRIYFTFFVVNGLVLASAFILSRKSWQALHLPTARQFKLLVKYALMALIANIIFFLVYRIDYWFVERLSSAEALGNYIQVSKLAQMLLIIPTIISSVVFPHTAGGMDRGQMKDNILRIGRVTTVLYCLLFTVMLLLGDWMFPFVFGNSYQLMYVPFLLLIPGIWALSNLFILSAYFGGTNQVKTNIIGAALGLVVIITGDLLLIKKYGIHAAALVSTAGYVVTFLYSFYQMKKEHLVSISEYWMIKKEDIKWLKAALQR